MQLPDVDMPHAEPPQRVPQVREQRRPGRVDHPNAVPNPETSLGGENEIVLFKSCFPNSRLGGNPGDPPTTGANPLRGRRLQEDYLLDTPGGQLRGRQSVLRIRVEPGKCLLTFKGPMQPSPMNT